jgi:tRNA U34 5-carboxymethylaminomethyl modifying GTPase MnmE/TrmE
VTPEEKLIVNRLKATFVDVDEMQKVFDIVTKTLALREAEIEQLKQYACQCEASVHSTQEGYAELQAEIERLKVEIFDQQEQRFWMQQRLSALLKRAADALEN